MNIALLAPAGLALLGTLVVPILIHLARRRRAQPTTFAALRWLAPGAPPRSRVQLEDLLLLALRLLLIALLASWLAQPVWRDAPALDGARIVVVPGVDPAAARAAVASGDATAHWLAPGWPAFDTPMPARHQPVASLLRAFDAELAAGAPLTVVVPAELGGLDAERVRLSRDVAWRIVPSSPSEARTAAKPDAVLLALRYGPEAATMPRYIAAAVAAWNAREPDRYHLDAQPWGAALAPGTTWLIGLDGAPDAAVIAWIEAGGVALLDADPRDAAAKDAGKRQRSSSAALRVHRRSFGAGAVVLPSAPLRAGRSAALLEPTFPARLNRWLAVAPPAPDRAPAASVAPVRGDVALSPPGRPLAPWIASAIALVFLFERWLANGPRLGRAR